MWPSCRPPGFLHCVVSQFRAPFFPLRSTQALGTHSLLPTWLWNESCDLTWCLALICKHVCHPLRVASKSLLASVHASPRVLPLVGHANTCVEGVGLQSVEHMEYVRTHASHVHVPLASCLPCDWHENGPHSNVWHLTSATGLTSGVPWTRSCNCWYLRPHCIWVPAPGSRGSFLLPVYTG